jgi:cation:H+ antiporter
MQLLIWSLVFIGALALLIKSADYFTNFSEKIGEILGVPQFIIGVSIVALGTSLPELVTSILATLRGYSSIVAANVVGSNIANILLVIGVATIYAKVVKIEKSLIKLDLPILSAITALLIVTLYDGTFTIWEGLVMLATYVVYISYNMYEHKQSQIEKIEHQVEEKVVETIDPQKKKACSRLAGLTLLSSVGIYFGADYTIQAIINLSELLNLAPAAIAISAVAIGTSLPELIVSIQAARKKNYEMILGNVIGSNILNSSIIMGIPALITPLNVTSEVITIAIPFLIISTILLTFSGIERKIFSFEGALYAILYFVFIGQLFNFL